MNDIRNDGADRDVSAHYRALADDRAPESLDRHVLDAAGKALRSTGSWQDRWYQPLTIAATVGLAFAFVMQLSDLSVTVGPPADTAPVLAPNPFEAAGRATQERVRDLQTEAAPSMRPGAAMSSSTMATDPRLSVLSADGLQSPTLSCSEDDRRSQSTWWACIRELEKNGNRQAAEAELQALLKAFPAFERPE